VARRPPLDERLLDGIREVVEGDAEIPQISVLSGYPLVNALLMPDRSRARLYEPCCERASVPATSVQSRTTKSVASTSIRPASSARIGIAAIVLEGKASATERRWSALSFAELR
jgi:hypothetical protein